MLQRVRIEGQPGTYVVLRVDTKRLAADLMLTTGKHEIEENVPFFAIERVTTESGNIEQQEPMETKDETATE